MNIKDRAIRESNRFSSSATDAGAPLVFVAPTGETATINGINIKHNQQVDDMGNKVNAQNAHITFSESLLTDAGYPVRANGIVNLNRHKVSTTDANGTTIQYRIATFMPNETTGIITCQLADFTDA